MLTDLRPLVPLEIYQCRLAENVKLFLINPSKTPENINDLIDYYNSTLQNLTDKYAPLQCKKIALRPYSPCTRVHNVERRGFAGGVKE